MKALIPTMGVQKQASVNWSEWSVSITDSDVFEDVSGRQTVHASSDGPQAMTSSDLARLDLMLEGADAAPDPSRLLPGAAGRWATGGRGADSANEDVSSVSLESLNFGRAQTASPAPVELLDQQKRQSEHYQFQFGRTLSEGSRLGLDSSGGASDLRAVTRQVSQPAPQTSGSSQPAIDIDITEH